MMSEKKFHECIHNLPKLIPSITGKAAYTNFIVKDYTLHFQRVNPRTNWTLDLTVLYDIYRNNSFINTTVIKKSTGGRVNSPSVAVLSAIGCIDKEGKRID